MTNELDWHDLKELPELDLYIKYGVEIERKDRKYKIRSMEIGEMIEKDGKLYLTFAVDDIVAWRYGNE